MFIKIILASFLAGLFELDETGAFQFMLSRSIVSGTITGLVLGMITGNPEIGIRFGFMIGLLFDMIWLFRLPIGASVPPDYQTASAVSISCFVLGLQGFPGKLVHPYLFLCIMTGFLAGYVGAWLDILVRRFNITLFRISRLYWSKGKFLKFKLMSIFGMFNFFMKAFVISIVMLGIILALNPVLNILFSKFPEFILNGFSIIPVFLPALGFIIIINHILKESSWFILILGLLTGATLFGFFKDYYIFGFFGIVLICAVLTLQLVHKEKKQ